MALNLATALGNHDRALALRSQRAEILANNIANADTPGYQARDFNFADVFGAVAAQGGSQLATTDDAHISTTTGMVPSGQLQYRIPSQRSLDGNTVDLQIEQAEYARNALDFQASFTFLNSKITGLRSALRGD